MLKPLFTLLLAAFAATATAQTATALVPQPAEATSGVGRFVFGKKVRTAVVGCPNDSAADVLRRFSADFTAATGIGVVMSKASRADLVMRHDITLPAEGYKLDVTAKRITIAAARPAGFFYALQTLKQLLPSRAVMAATPDTGVTVWAVPAVSIADAPRFGWRGFMIDEGRHFFGMQEIKRIIDVMAAYKMNRLHWHLTEDQGWRLEIKKYPLLTEKSAWRPTRVLGWGDVKPDGIHYGGYYTQADAREIVRYARERFIEIVPEVDIPGHSQAAVAAYPEFLACDPDSAHEVWRYQGVSTDVINVASPRAVQFAKDVVDELTDIFPFGYIHLGGDECPTVKWQANAECRKLLGELGSSNYRDLQIHFYKQIIDHIAAQPAARHRRLIFWNEVLHGNTAPLGKDITVMAWIGADAAARQAIERGFDVVLSPQIPYYINRRQSKLPTEPRSQGHGTETVEAVYAYKPMDKATAAQTARCLGVQANFWTEWVEDGRTVEYLMLPRLAAVAEAGWTPADRRDWPSFRRRLQSERSFYDLKGLSYGRHIFE